MENRRRIVLRWADQGLLDSESLEEALKLAEVIPDTSRWRIFVRNLFLWLGGLALAFSVMFFIAYNWDTIGRFAKFGLIELLVAACVIVYWLRNPDSLVARISLMMAAILLGVLLAFYGQTYQTGADPWQLFATWALLMLPWALVSRFSALWALWIALLNLSITLYFQARGGLFWFAYNLGENLYWVLFLFNTVVWVAWEFLATRITWLQERWTVRLVAIACGVPITTLSCVAVFTQYPSRAVALLVYAAWLAILVAIYRKRIPDLFMLAGVCLSVIVFLTTFLGYHLLRSGDAVGGFLIMSLLVIGMVAGAAVWLKKIYREQQA